MDSPTFPRPDGRPVLEIGSAYGYSTILMAQVAESVVAVDPHEGYGSLEGSYERMCANLRAYGVEDKVTIIRAPSWTLTDSEEFDLVFVDGDHRRISVIDDILIADDVLDGGGEIVFHDYGEDTCPGVREALDEEFPDGPDELVDTLWLRHP